jgi:hypothetical protein
MNACKAHLCGIGGRGAHLCVHLPHVSYTTSQIQPVKGCQRHAFVKQSWMTCALKSSFRTSSRLGKPPHAAGGHPLTFSLVSDCEVTPPRPEPSFFTLMVPNTCNFDVTANITRKQSMLLLTRACTRLFPRGKSTHP